MDISAQPLIFNRKEFLINLDNWRCLYPSSLSVIMMREQINLWLQCWIDKNRERRLYAVQDAKLPSLQDVIRMVRSPYTRGQIEAFFPYFLKHYEEAMTTELITVIGDQMLRHANVERFSGYGTCTVSVQLHSC